jgi:hypothetical protein
MIIIYNAEKWTTLQRDPKEKSTHLIKKCLRNAEGRTRIVDNTFLRRGMNSKLVKRVRREWITVICP